ncbi:MAG: hypothetical protein MR696_11765 [Lachnospiraceae bacterium]|nr:hypothetical protein [Lachnospiraceae bacterium]
MKIIFNDATEMPVQSVIEKDGQLMIKAAAVIIDVLRAKFSDKLATKKMEVVEREQVIAVYEDYTTLYRLEEYTGKIYGVVMYQEKKTPEVQAEIQTAAIAVAQIQAQALTDEQALSAQAIYPAWSGNGVIYTVDYKVLYDGTLYKCLQAHTSQAYWTPDTAPSLWAKVLITDPEVIAEWEQPDSTNPYSKGDRVTHNGKTWESLVDNNVWEPGVYGWTEVA